jgi:transposase
MVGILEMDGLGSARKSGRKGGEVLVGPERRRRWSVEEKLGILSEAMAPGALVSAVCRRHGVGSGQLYTWRGQLRRGELTGFAPVLVEQEALALPQPASAPPVARPCPSPVAPPGDMAGAGLIELVLPSGVVVRLRGAVDLSLLGRVLSVLER